MSALISRALNYEIRILLRRRFQFETEEFEIS